LTAQYRAVCQGAFMTHTTKPVRLSGVHALKYLGLSEDDYVVIKAPIPGSILRVGTPLELKRYPDRPPEYLLLGTHYPAVQLIRAIQKQDPEIIERAVHSATHAGRRQLRKHKVSERDKAILDMAERGLTYVEIGERAGGIKRQRVKQILDRLANLGYGQADTREVRRQEREGLLAEARATYRSRDDAPLSRDHPMYKRLQLTRSRATANGIPFSISEADFAELPTHCPALGIELQYDGNRGKGAFDDSPSLDRIVPSLGYVPGNVVIISQRANRIKNDATVEELVKIAEFFSKLTGKTLDKTN